MTSNCPLCLSDKIKEKLNAEKPFPAKYYHCSVCELTFIGREYLLNQSTEKSRYDFHENNIEDAGYTNFLNRLIAPTKNFITSSDIGLDYGSGPEPVLAELMQRDGFKVDIFDPIYAKKSIEKSYDFITSTEVIEHFHEPRKSFDHMLSLLNSNGVLALMTSILNDSIDFKHWSYRYDDTHVSFYSNETFIWLANHYKLELIHSEKNVRIFRKITS